MSTSKTPRNNISYLLEGMHGTIDRILSPKSTDWIDALRDVRTDFVPTDQVVRIAIMTNWLWETVLPAAQFKVDEVSEYAGQQWRNMIAERTNHACHLAANAISNSDTITARSPAFYLRWAATAAAATTLHGVTTTAAFEIGYAADTIVRYCGPETRLYPSGPGPESFPDRTELLATIDPIGLLRKLNSIGALSSAS